MKNIKKFIGLGGFCVLALMLQAAGSCSSCFAGLGGKFQAVIQPLIPLGPRPSPCTDPNNELTQIGKTKKVIFVTRETYADPQSQTGQSWSYAFDSLNKGLDAAIAEIQNGEAVLMVVGKGHYSLSHERDKKRGGMAENASVLSLANLKGLEIIGGFEFSNKCLENGVGNDTVLDGEEKSKHVLAILGGVNNVTLKNLTIQGGDAVAGLGRSYIAADDYGGGILISGDAKNVTLTNVKVEDNKARKGGFGIAIIGGVDDVRMAEMDIKDNTQSGIDFSVANLGKYEDSSGGGVLVRAAMDYDEINPDASKKPKNITIESGFIKNHRVFYHGAGLLALDAIDITVREMQIENNEAGVSKIGVKLVGPSLRASHAAYGAGIAMFDVASVTLEKNTIQNNRNLVGDGGGVYIIRGTTANIKEKNTIFKNKALSETRGSSGATEALGGGIAVLEFKDVLFDDNTLNENVAENGDGGGAYFNDVGILKFQNNKLKDNKVLSQAKADGSQRVNHGGGVRILNSNSVTFSQNQLNGNRTENGNGGGAYLRNVTASLKVFSNTIENNRSFSSGAVSETMSNGGNGGGLFIQNCSGLVFSVAEPLSQMKGNAATYFGGGLVIDDSVGIGPANTIVLGQLNMENNFAGGRGGAVYINRGSKNPKIEVWAGQYNNNGIAPNDYPIPGAKTASGGAFYILNISNISFKSTKTSVAGKGEQGQTLEIAGNEASLFGGGIYLEGFYSIVEMEGFVIPKQKLGAKKIAEQKVPVSVTGNKSPKGAGIYVLLADKLDISGSVVSNNVASQMGGGIFLNEVQNLSFKTTEIEKNQAPNGGGGVYVGNLRSGFFKYDGGRLDGNISSNGQGGGILISSVLLGTSIIQSAQISGNQALRGGGLYFEGVEKLDIRNSNMNSNIANIVSGQPSPQAITSGAITSLDGGAIFAVGKELAIDGGSMRDNSARDNGGAIYFQGPGSTVPNSSIYIQNSNSSNNTAKNGGTFFFSEVESIGWGNYASAIWFTQNYFNEFSLGEIASGAPAATNSNIASIAGGAAFIDKCDDVRMTNLRFRENKAPRGGAVLIQNSNKLTAKGVTAYKNEASDGGFMLLDGVPQIDVDFNHDVMAFLSLSVVPHLKQPGYAYEQKMEKLQEVGFFQNSAQGQGGAFYIMNANDVRFSNVLFGKNIASAGSAIYLNGLKNKFEIKDYFLFRNKSVQPVRPIDITGAGTQTFSSAGLLHLSYENVPIEQ